MNLEDPVEMADLECIHDYRAEAAELDASLGALDLAVELDEVGQHGTGDEVGVGQVQEDLRLLPGLDEVDQLLADRLNLVTLEHRQGLPEGDHRNSLDVLDDDPFILGKGHGISSWGRSTTAII